MTDTSEQKALTWDELVKQNGGYFVEHVKLALSGALRAIDKHAVEPTAMTAFQVDAVLSALTQQLIPLNRPGSMSRERTTAVAMTDPAVAKKVADRAEAKAEKIKRQKAAFKGHATRAKNKQAAASAETLYAEDESDDNE